jgi:hypothetical protein
MDAIFLHLNMQNLAQRLPKVRKTFVFFFICFFLFVFLKAYHLKKKSGLLNKLKTDNLFMIVPK